MNIQRFLPALLATLLVAPVWAQTASKPLNLKLPPGDVPPSDVPAPSSSAKNPASSSTAPGVYYGDTSGRIEDDTRVADSANDCDDSKYNQPQMHGSVGMGVVSGNHVSGSYQTGSVNITKAFGSCDHPTGGISISVGGSNGNFHGRGH
jgi:hypothetical protein